MLSSLVCPATGRYMHPVGTIGSRHGFTLHYRQAGFGYRRQHRNHPLLRARWLLAPPQRTAANYRIYGADDVARLRFVRRTRDLGFSLDQVRALLSISGQLDSSCCGVSAIATDHLAEIDRKIVDLTALRRELADAVAACADGTVAECRILEAFSPVNR